MAGAPGPSKKKQKQNEYFKATRDADRKFEALGLNRPQDESKDLLQRTRQVNFGLIRYESNPNSERILKSKPMPGIEQPWMDWNCYSSLEENGEPRPIWIQTEDDFLSMMGKLRVCEEISFDLECHNNHTLKGYVALIQIGTWQFGDFLIDPFKLRRLITTDLKEILEDPGKLKVGHDVRNDSKWLQRDFDIFPVGFIDLQVMWSFCDEEEMVSLKKLMFQFYPELDKLFEAMTFSDWRLRPGKGMTKAQEVYAVNDVHITLRIFDRLRSQLTEDRFFETFEMTKHRLLPLSSDLMPKPGFDFQKLAEDELKKFGRSTMGRGKTLSRTQFNILMALMEWRDNMSKVLDEPAENLVRGILLVEIACLEPDVKALRNKIGKTHPAIVPQDPNEKKGHQLPMLARIIETGGIYIEAMRQMECHNCLKRLHGPAWTCPFPKNPDSLKIYMKRPENRATNYKQNDRRYMRMKEQYGKEVADREFEKWTGRKRGTD